MVEEKRDSGGALPPPRCKALLLCERAIVEADTANVSLISVFDQCSVPEIPGTVSPFTVYTQLTDGIQGHDYQFTVEIHDLTNDVVIARSPYVELNWADRLTRVGLIIPILHLPIANAGVYDVVILANRQEVDRQQFRVAALPNETSEEEGEHDG